MRKYMNEHIEFLREGYKTMSISDLTNAFNKKFGMDQSGSSLRDIMSRQGIKTCRTGGNPPGFLPERYTSEQINFLREKYKSMLIPELTKEFNTKFKQCRTQGGIMGALARRGIKSGRKQGRSPFVAKKIGSERVCPSSGFVWIKIDEPDPNQAGNARQRHKHMVVWEKANGPLPEGHRLRFLDGNKQNCTLENMALFTMTENMFLNHLKFNSAPDELRETIILTAKLKAKACERRKELLESEGVEIELRPEEA